MRVIIRAYTSNGYHKDIVYMDDQQIRMSYTKIKEVCPGGNVGVSIDPKEFPEMDRFEIIVEKCR